MNQESSLRTPLKRVRALGSARDGTSHFIWQRLTAVVLVPLSVWFIFSIMSLAAYGTRLELMTWMQSGFNAAALILLLLALFYHAKLGMQVIIEDYMHCACVKLTALVLSTLVMAAATLLSVLSVLKMHFATGATVPGVMP